MDDFSAGVTPPPDLEALRRELEKARAELSAARREQAASAEVLRIVGRSGADAAPVFDAILDACLRLFSPYGAAIYLVEGEMAKGVARRGFSDGDWGTDARPLAGSHTGEALATRRPVHIEDLADIPRLPEDKRAAVRAHGGLTTLYVPMLSGERGIGSLVVARRPKQPFSQAEITALSAFADQAVIAIENARLFRETQEAAAQRTATADVLKAINRSAFDAEAVLETLINAGVSLSGSSNGLIWQYQDGLMHVRAAARGESREDFVAHMRAHPQPPGRGSAVARVALTGEIQNIPDMHADLEFAAALRERVQTRATLAVPMKRGDDLVGAIVMSKPEAGAYPQRLVELVKTFADQAVIAIENARLFEEVRARTRETEEALERQTATSKILEVIASSPTDAAPVFQAIAASATAVIRGHSTGVWRFVDGYAHLVGYTPTTPEADAALLALSPAPIADVAIFVSAQGGESVATEDTEAADPRIREVARARGFRSMLFTPLMRRGEPIGFISVTRVAPGPFSAGDFAQLRAFADQAVIAIENARLFEEVQARTRDLEESLAQQTATADVLKVISRSAFDLDVVLTTLAQSALAQCRGRAAYVVLRDGDELEFKAMVGETSPAFLEVIKQSRLRVRPDTLTGRPVATGEVVHVPDARSDHELTWGRERELAEFGSGLGVPLILDGERIGAFVIGHSEPRAFTPKLVELVTMFADQAVIAIKNVRLFEQVQAKTRDLEEALAQQTATADVLKVISSSPSDLKPVLDAIADTAARLCGSDMAMFFRYDGEVFRILASWNFPPDVQAMLEAKAPAPGHPSALGRAGATLKPVYIPDVTADPDYGLKVEQAKARYRATLAVPMLREGRLVGALSLNRAEPNAFTQKHIELVSTFADQAAIAVENVRLFEEVKAHTREAEAALERQTATSKILEVIASSPSDAGPVFEAIAESASALLRGRSAAVYHFIDGFVHLMAATSISPEADAAIRATFPAPLADFAPIKLVSHGEVAEVPDTELSEIETWRALARVRGYRSLALVPLMQRGAPIGLLAAARPEPGAFAPADVALLRAFADQAVIAIENARLFEEVQARTREVEEALAQQTATANVLKTISRSAFDLQAVLDTLAASAKRLMRATAAGVYVRKDDVLVLLAHTEDHLEVTKYVRANPIKPGRNSMLGRALLTGQIQNVGDYYADEEIDPRLRSMQTPPALLVVPMVRNGVVVGAINVAREEKGQYTAREVELLETFADQAVIALDNARLFEEVQARTRELEQSLSDLHKAQDRLVQSEKLASLGQLTAGIAHEIKNPLNFVNNFAALSRELLAELRETLALLPEAAKAETEDLMGLIDSNLEKVASHGKRADSIVKNMLLHSREGSGERARADVNAVVEEALNLAYHGARAEKPGFNVTIEKTLDPSTGEAELYLQEITRVLLNLISNGFYAAARRRETEGPDYQPMLKASTRALGAQVEIRICDNGPGITDEVRAKMFNPFFTTKPAGEGTGLGLSLSHDIVVKQHGGSLEVETRPGWTEFIVTLPRFGG